MPSQAAESRRHNYGLRVQPLQNCRGRKLLVMVKEQKGDLWDISVAEKGKWEFFFFLNCPFESFTHFSNGFLVFFLLIYSSSLCMMVIRRLL